MKVESELKIARPALEVWTYAADVARHPDWMTVTDARVTSGDGVRVGSRGREGMNLGPVHFDVDFEVAEAEPGRRILWRSVGGAPFGLEVALDLAPDGPTATHATYSSSVELRGLWRLAGPLVRMEARAGVARQLRKLKERVEASSVKVPPGN